MKVLSYIAGENIHRFGTKFQDFGTSDFITGLMEVHEKMAWFLRSHLKVKVPLSLN